MTNSTDDILGLWNDHVHHLHDINAYQPDASILYVSTASGASGRDGLLDFFHKNSKSVIDLCEIPPLNISTVYQGNKLTQELLIKFTNSEGVSWLLPGNAIVKMHHPLGYPAKKKIIELPIVLSVEYKDEKIQHLKIYWDQATVLRQSGILDELKTTEKSTFEFEFSRLPILEKHAFFVDTKAAEESPKKRLSNSVIGSILAGAQETVEPRKESFSKTSGIFASEVDSNYQRPSTRVNSAFVGGKSSDIFAPAPEVTKAAVPTRPISGVFSDPNANEKATTRVTSATPASGIFQNDPPVKPVDNSYGPISNVFSNAPENVRPSTRVNSAYVGGKSNDIFGPPKQDLKVSINPNPRRYESSLNSAGIVTNEEAQDVNYHTKRMDPNSNKSHFSIGNAPSEEDSIKESTKRQLGDHNQSHFQISDNVEEAPRPAAPRPSSSYNNSQINFKQDPQTATLPPQPVSNHENKRNESHWNFQDNIPVNIKPSSRVLNVPGGKSSITFG